MQPEDLQERWKEQGDASASLIRSVDTEADTPEAQPHGGAVSLGKEDLFPSSTQASRRAKK